MAKPSHARTGEVVYASMEKINSELLSMTYGAIVMQMIKDYKDVKIVNNELDRFGYNIGVRLIDEFLAKSGVASCSNFKETAQVIAKIAFKMFLGITAEVVKWRDDGKQFSLTFKGNPLIDFVELPAQYADLNYDNILCGVIRGALNMVNLVVECAFVSSELKGGTESEIRVTLKEVVQEVYQDEEDDH